MKPVNVLFDKKLNKYQNPYPFPNGKKQGEFSGREGGDEMDFLNKRNELDFIEIQKSNLVCDET